uniref:Uncharacterized protein n=1 Tax=Arundo donax TaxID=35708 RepID=A0A0A8ZYY2_ARUDO
MSDVFFLRLSYVMLILIKFKLLSFGHQSKCFCVKQQLCISLFSKLVQCRFG